MSYPLWITGRMPSYASNGFELMPCLSTSRNMFGEYSYCVVGASSLVDASLDPSSSHCSENLPLLRSGKNEPGTKNLVRVNFLVSIEILSWSEKICASLNIKNKIKS